MVLKKIEFYEIVIISKPIYLFKRISKGTNIPTIEWPLFCCMIFQNYDMNLIEQLYQFLIEMLGFQMGKFDIVVAYSLWKRLL